MFIIPDYYEVLQVVFNYDARKVTNTFQKHGTVLGYKPSEKDILYKFYSDFDWFLVF